MNKCNRCNKNLNINNFKKRKNGEYYKQCINCNQKSSANKLKNVKIKLNENSDYDSNTHSKCIRCYNILEISKFNKSKKGITKSCTKCLLISKQKFEDKMNKKIDLSNEDHCGPCGQYILDKTKPRMD